MILKTTTKSSSSVCKWVLYGTEVQNLQRHSHLVFIQCPCFKSTCAMFCPLTNSSQYHYTMIWSCCRAIAQGKLGALGTGNIVPGPVMKRRVRKCSRPKNCVPRACEVPCPVLFSYVNSRKCNQTPPGDFCNTKRWNMFLCG